MKEFKYKLKYKLGDIITIRSLEEILKLHPEYLADAGMNINNWSGACGKTGPITVINDHHKWPYSVKVKMEDKKEEFWFHEDEIYSLKEKLEMLDDQI